MGLVDTHQPALVKCQRPEDDLEKQREPARPSSTREPCLSQIWAAAFSNLLDPETFVRVEPDGKLSSSSIQHEEDAGRDNWTDLAGSKHTREGGADFSIETSSELHRCTENRNETGQLDTKVGSVASENLDSDVELGVIEITDARGHRHNAVKSRILKSLDQLIGSDKSALLMCWGKGDQCCILTAPISNSKDSVAQWAEARRAWTQQKASWRSRVPWYGVTSVKVVEVTIVGEALQVKRKTHGAETLLGMYRVEDPNAKISKLEQIISDHIDERLVCERNSSTGQWEHSNECCDLWDISPDWDCPYEVRHQAKRAHSQLIRRPTLKMFFKTPELARLNDSMDDLNILISHWELLYRMDQFHCPKLAELSFPGLLIQEGWLVTKPQQTLPLVGMTLLALSGVSAWIIYKDWAVAWQVGGCFLAFVALVGAWVHNVVD
ncbi:hypothetical protein AB5N19_11807 [Seiridium cardinale]